MGELDKKFEEQVMEYAGKIVYIKYYDLNKHESLHEPYVISSINRDNLIAVTASDSALLYRYLARPLVELLYSKEDDELIQNPSYRKELEINDDKVK